MNKKSLIILCVIFAVLIGLVFVKQTFKPKVPTTEEIADIIVPSINVDDFSEIDLRLGDGNTEDETKPKSVQLVKEGDQWIVKSKYGVYANEKAIKPVLDKLDQLKGELRSNKKDLLTDYGIDDNEGVHVDLVGQGGKAVRVVVGTEKADYQNDFVRLGGSNAVYIVNENLLGLLGVRDEGDNRKLDVDKWVDKRIAHLKVDDVAGIAIAEMVNGTEETVIDLKKETVDDKKIWQSAQPYTFGLSASKIKSLLEQFNSTYARDVVAPDVEGVFDSPSWKGTFTYENGDQIVLVRGSKDAEGNNYYVKQEGAGYYYLVPTSTFDNREKKQGDIFANNPFKVEEENINGIEINDVSNKKKFSVAKKASSEAAPPAEGEEGQEKKEQFVWQGSNGETVEEAKVKDIVSKIKSMTVEVIPQSIPFPGEALVIDLTEESGSNKLTISTDVKLENGQECQLLKLEGDSQNYCVSKAQVTALMNVVP